MSTPSKSWSERVAPGEAALFDTLAASLRGLQHGAGGKDRGLHAKAHGGARAELTVAGDLPEWARVGIFEAASTWRGYVRFSNGSGLRAADKVPDVRGVALKLVGVPGKKLIPGLETCVTQDFLAIRAPATPFHDVKAFVGVVLAARGSKLLALPRIISALGFGRFISVLKQLNAGLAEPISSVATATYYSALPIRWGEMAVKFSFAPVSSVDPTGIVKADAPNFLADELAARLAAGPVVYSMRIQPFIDEQRTPIEDPTVVWDEAASPWVTVGTLTLPRQDLRSDQGKRLAESIEKMSFDPWHAPVEFRPLGALMRARAAAYRESVKERAAASEPDGEETWG